MLTGERRTAWSGYFFWAGDVIGEDVITFDEPVTIKSRSRLANWREWFSRWKK